MTENRTPCPPCDDSGFRRDIGPNLPEFPRPDTRQPVHHSPPRIWRIHNLCDSLFRNRFDSCDDLSAVSPAAPPEKVVQDRGVSLQGVTGLNGVVPLPGRENRAADERQPHKKTRLVRLPPEDVCMALHRHLAISYLYQQQPHWAFVYS
jgi:hypothetical protein